MITPTDVIDSENSTQMFVLNIKYQFSGPSLTRESGRIAQDSAIFLIFIIIKTMFKEKEGRREGISVTSIGHTYQVLHLKKGQTVRNQQRV